MAILLHGTTRVRAERILVVGPTIVAVDVPEEIIAMAAGEYLPRSQGLVQFDEGAGLEELCAAWPTLRKEVRIP